MLKSRKKQDELQFNDKRETIVRRRRIRKAVMWILEIALVIGAAYALCSFCLEKTTVLGDSMSPTLNAGEKIYVNKCAYLFRKPKRYDVVCFKQSGKEHSYYNIKRIIGLPGETVLIREGEVLIDGVRLDDDPGTEKILNGGLANTEIKLEDEEYFVLGDYRNHSEDSRFANIGNIVKGDMIGSAWIKEEPFAFITSLTKEARKNKAEKEKPAEDAESEE